MPRVNFVKKARKDNPVCKKGESYYWWKFRYGGKHYSLTHPKQSQLTQSDKLSRLYSCSENVQDLSSYVSMHDYDEVADFLREQADEAREVASEYEDAADAKEEYFPDSGEEIREKAYAAESFADELETLADEVENLPDDESIKEEFEDEIDGLNQDEIEEFINQKREEYIDECVSGNEPSLDL